jgi:hypothetical protein
MVKYIYRLENLRLVKKTIKSCKKSTLYFTLLRDSLVKSHTKLEYFREYYKKNVLPSEISAHVGLLIL